jgi:hypothetical protein
VAYTYVSSVHICDVAKQTRKACISVGANFDPQTGELV